MSNGSGSSGCLKIFGCGCAVIVGFILVCVVLVFSGWDIVRNLPGIRSVAEKVDAAKAEAVEMKKLQENLQADYPARHIGTHANINSVNGKTTRTFSIEFVEPRFALPDDVSAQNATARAIALAVAARYPLIDHWDKLQLEIVRDGDGGSRMRSTSTFEFEISDLRAEQTGKRE